MSRAAAATVLAACIIPHPGWAQKPSFPPVDELRGKAIGELILRRGVYGKQPADWGVVQVPENRRAEGSRPIRLHCVRQVAKRKNAEALFSFVGGPGNSNIFGSGEFSESLRARYDIVRVGYRGIDSTPALKCPEFTEALLAEDEPLRAASIARIRTAVRRGYDRLRKSGIDLDGYSLFDVVHDIECVRKALGYERVHLFGISWGSQIAYAYAAHYPKRVARIVLVGAGGRARGFDLWRPRAIEALLAEYAERWKRDAKAAARTPDLTGTITKVLATLPRRWEGRRIGRDKVRLVLWYMLRETGDAARAFDAIVAAHEGDLAGLAVMSWLYDDDLAKERRRRFGPYHAEFFCKVASSGLDLERDWVGEMDPAGSVIGSPAAKLLWGTVSRGGWPVAAVPESYRENSVLDHETLVVMGDLDFASPLVHVREELMPVLKRGRLVVLENMGHTDVARLQPAAFFATVGRFLSAGDVDTAAFAPHRIDFAPAARLRDTAKRVFGSKK